jgi:hypothetical protein
VVEAEGEAAQTFNDRMLSERPWEEDADFMWLKMTTCIQKLVSEVFGVSTGGKQEAKTPLGGMIGAKSY